jgi:tetratricopeptide (TPR) repeat protein
VFVVFAVFVALWSSWMGRGLEAQAADSEADRAARVHYREGETHYQAGRYADALVAYQAGYDVQPLPGFLVNIAQCQRRIGDLERARATYGKFVLVAPDSPLVPEVRGLIEELDRLIAETERARRLPSASGADATMSPSGVERASAPGRAIRPPRAVDPGASSGPIAAGADLSATATTRAGAPEGATPTASHHRWWLWGSAAAVAVGLTTLAVVISAPGAHTISDGSLGSLRR